MRKDFASAGPRRRTSTLCWTARTVPFVVGCFLFASSITRLITWQPHPYLLLGLIPLLLALIAWNNHLAGGLAIVVLTCAILCSVSDTDTVYTGLPFAIPFMIGGALHVAVWWTEKRGTDTRGLRFTSKKGLKVLRRIALAVSLVPGAVLVSAFLGISLHNMVHEVAPPFTYPFYLVFWSAALLLMAGCARQSPLFGGLLYVLASVGGLSWLAQADNPGFPLWASLPFFFIILAAGITYLVVWCGERQDGGPRRNTFVG